MESDSRKATDIMITEAFMQIAQEKEKPTGERLHALIQAVARIEHQRKVDMERVKTELTILQAERGL